MSNTDQVAKTGPNPKWRIHVDFLHYHNNGKNNYNYYYYEPSYTAEETSESTEDSSSSSSSEERNSQHTESSSKENRAKSLIEPHYINKTRLFLNNRVFYVYYLEAKAPIGSQGARTIGSAS